MDTNEVSKQTILDISIREVPKLFKEDNKFIKELNKYFQFYSYEFTKYIKGRPNQDEFNQRLFLYNKEVFYNGYIVGLEFISHPQTEIDDEFLAEPNGILKEKVNQLMLEATQDFNLLISTSRTADFESWVIENYPNGENLLFQTKKSTGLFGSYYAFLYERERRGVYIKEEHGEGDFVGGLINRSDDVIFVTPHSYLICNYTNKLHETWELVESLAYDGEGAKIGEIHLQISDESLGNKLSMHLPYYQEMGERIGNSYTLTCSLSSDKLSNVIKKSIVDQVSELLAQRLNIKVNNILKRVIEVNNFLVLE